MSKRLARILFSLLVVVLLIYLQETPTSPSSEPIQLYATMCHDDLRKIYTNAIEEAQKSIYMVMYSLTDEHVIDALNKQAHNGIEITLTHDTSTQQQGYAQLQKIHRIPIRISGLMHQKLLIIDGEKVWIGSANMTTESLRLHDNLVTSFTSKELAEVVCSKRSNTSLSIGNQHVEYWNLPRARKEAFQRLITLIEQAEESIHVAMYTWTHPEIAEAIVRAHTRGVQVEVVLDRGQANGVGKKILTRLLNSGIEVRTSRGQKLLHHKFLWIDRKILVNGSANWTKAAFSRNQDCFFVLHKLTEEQVKKIETMWKRTRILANKQHLLVFWQRPESIGDHQLELIAMAA